MLQDVSVDNTINIFLIISYYLSNCYHLEYKIIKVLFVFHFKKMLSKLNTNHIILSDIHYIMLHGFRFSNYSLVS
jgi:hypothetical protein